MFRQTVDKTWPKTLWFQTTLFIIKSNVYPKSFCYKVNKEENKVGDWMQAQTKSERYATITIEWRAKGN